MIRRFARWIPASLRHPLLPVFAAIMAAVGLATYAILVDSQDRIIEHEALKIAEVVTRQALAARTVYANAVVDKLKSDGFGAHIAAEQHPGYVPLPAQFLKLVGKASNLSSEGLHSYRPLSKWNLEPTQGLTDDFQHWAWGRLEAQDRAEPQGPIAWQPAWRIEQVNGVKSLRYMSADPAASAGCVSCHNDLEALPQTRALRVAAGVAPDKQWKLHQLLGAIEVDVPLDRVEALAASQARRTIALVLAVSLVGLFGAAVYAFYDLRRKQNLAANLERLSQSLEERVRERTAELEAALGELETFSYSVSHDLRAPLRAIGAFSRMVVEDEGATLSAEGRRKLAVVERNALKMGELVDDLLALARLSRAGLKLAPLDPGALSRSIAEELRPLYREAEVVIGPLPLALGDETLLRQALVNLLDNALKYSSKSALPRVEVGWSAGERAYFVRDNGVGFDPAYAGKLFRPFERLHAESEFNGLGIGLAIVKRVIERHGGRVWAESTRGEGATFWFTIGPGAAR